MAACGTVRNVYENQRTSIFLVELNLAVFIFTDALSIEASH